VRPQVLVPDLDQPEDAVSAELVTELKTSIQRTARARIVSMLGPATSLAGIVYVLVVLRRMLRQVEYKPVLEDWIWHQVLPMIGYAMLFVGAAGMSHDQRWALFVIGAVALLLLFVGIHNAWDTVAYVVGTEGEKK